MSIDMTVRMYPMKNASMFFDKFKDGGLLEPATESDYENFCAGVMMYLHMFGLTDWHVNFYWEDNDGTAAAYVSYNYELREASFVFGRRIHKGFKDSSVMMMKLALHEVLHLLFAEFDYLNKGVELTAAQRQEMLEAAEHGVIRRLEGVILSVPNPESGNYILHRIGAAETKESDDE